VRQGIAPVSGGSVRLVSDHRAEELSIVIRRVVVVAGLLVVAAAALGLWHWLEAPAAATVEPAGAAGVPVDAATASRADVPVYLRGLGTVQAYNTVTVHSRVDGEIVKIAFTEGQDVKTGDLLAELDPRPLQAQLDQATAKQAQDQAQLDNAKLDLARFQTLGQREFASRQSIDTQAATVRQLDATIKGDQAMIDNAKVQLGYTTITSPIDGRTGVRLVDQGNIVHATDPTGLVVITQLRPISLVFTLAEDNLPAISKAMAGRALTVIALSRDEKDQYGEGTLSLVDNQIDQSTGTVRPKATFPNTDLALWPGQFVNARLLLRTESNVVTVPSDAVQRGAQGMYAYVVKPDSTVALQPVKVGQISAGTAVIESGIEEGQRVVVAGQYRLQPGAKVVPRADASAAPPIAASGSADGAAKRSGSGP
jgi:membrane fusion protein, multidrug efflux system